MPAEKSEKVARELLERHLSHELARFEESDMKSWLQEVLQMLWKEYETITLSQLVPAKNVMATIRLNVIEREIPGAVAEIAGESAASLFNADFHLQTLVEDIISSRQIEEFVDKTLELKDHREAFMEKVIQQPIYAELVSDLMYRGIVRYIYEENVISKKIPAVSSMLKFSTKMVNKTVPKLEGAVEDSVKSFIGDNIQMLLSQSQSFLSEALTEQELKEILQDIWLGIESKELGELQSGIDSIDLTEFVVLGYEFWKSFRTTEYFEASCQHIVDHIYKKYGEEPLVSLLEDFGVTPEGLLTEISIYMPEVLDVLKSSGFIETVLRKRLESFYFASDTQAYLTTVTG